MYEIEYRDQALLDIAKLKKDDRKDDGQDKSTKSIALYIAYMRQRL